MLKSSLLRWVSRFAAPVVTAGLVACGGGGGGAGDDLNVAFSYSPATVPVLSPMSVIPVIDGLEGETPKCRVRSGSLPPGVSVVAGCVVRGTPTALGEYRSQIELTVDGFSGSVSASVLLSVALPRLEPVPNDRADVNQEVALGTELSSLPLVTLQMLAGRPYEAQPGNVISYRVVDGELPSGLTLSPSDGTLSGTPNTFGVSSFQLGATLSRDGLSFELAPIEIRVDSIVSGLTLSYQGCCTSSQVGDRVDESPTINLVPIEGATFIYNASGLPPGLSIDTTTGRIFGNLTKGGDYLASARLRVDLPDGTTVYGEASLQWTVNSPFFRYLQSSYSIFAGTPFQIEPEPIENGLPADVYRFAIVDTPGFGRPAPAWISVDPATGVLTGTSPTPTAADTWESVTVVMTFARGGIDYTTTAVVGLQLN